MRFSIQNWIEEVKVKPENVRYRYMLGCVGVSMFFVVIVWSLTVTENFKSTASSTETEKTMGGILPKASDFSLDQILSGEENLESTQPKSGEEFLREQAENRARLNPDDEGLRPKGEEGETETDATIESMTMPTLP